MTPSQTRAVSLKRPRENLVQVRIQKLERFRCQPPTDNLKICSCWSVSDVSLPCLLPFLPFCPPASGLCCPHTGSFPAEFTGPPSFSLEGLTDMPRNVPCYFSLHFSNQSSRQTRSALTVTEPQLERRPSSLQPSLLEAVKSSWTPGECGFTNPRTDMTPFSLRWPGLWSLLLSMCS